MYKEFGIVIFTNLLTIQVILLSYRIMEELASKEKSHTSEEVHDMLAKMFNVTQQFDFNTTYEKFMNDNKDTAEAIEEPDISTKSQIYKPKKFSGEKLVAEELEKFSKFIKREVTPLITSFAEDDIDKVQDIDRVISNCQVSDDYITFYISE